LPRTNSTCSTHDNTFSSEIRNPISVYGLLVQTIRLESVDLESRCQSQNYFNDLKQRSVESKKWRNDIDCSKLFGISNVDGNQTMNVCCTAHRVSSLSLGQSSVVLRLDRGLINALNVFDFKQTLHAAWGNNGATNTSIRGF
jgi:hypothetical protein